MLLAIGCKFSLLLFAIALTACASTAHRPYACENSLEKMYYYSWFYWLIGTTVQQGDCAAINPLKFETGEFYSNHKSTIEHEVSAKIAINGISTPGLDSFAKSLNCEEKAWKQFGILITEHKDKVFGPAFDRSSREVTKSAIEMIRNNSDLSRGCSP